MKVKYPDGVTPTMPNYKRKPIKHKMPWQKGHRKFFNHKVVYDGHKFDSKTERDYYIYLKQQGIKCSLHKRYTVIPHTEYRSKVDGKIKKIRKRNYTPDFVLYDKHGNITEVDDVKGISQFPSYDRLRMNLFSLRYHIPVTIVRRGRHGTFRKKEV